MQRLGLLVLAALVAVALAACASSEDESAGAIAPAVARASVERAAHVDLAAAPIPADARDQGLRASYTNAATAIDDKQVVALFVMKDAGVADAIHDMVRETAPKSARMIVHDEVIVVYAPAGKNRGTAVEKAVEAL